MTDLRDRGIPGASRDDSRTRHRARLDLHRRAQRLGWSDTRHRRARDAPRRHTSAAARARGGFEAVLAIHTGVERVGRYIQVFFEDATSDPGWESPVMTYGRMFPGERQRSDVHRDIFSPRPSSTSFQYCSPARCPIEYGVVGTIHALFAARVLLARRHAVRQRALDLDRFQAIKGLRVSGFGLRASGGYRSYRQGTVGNVLRNPSRNYDAAERDTDSHDDAHGTSEQAAAMDCGHRRARSPGRYVCPGAMGSIREGRPPPALHGQGPNVSF